MLGEGTWVRPLPQAPDEAALTDRATDGATDGHHPRRAIPSWGTEPLIAVLLSMALGAPLLAWGPPGVDLAAHLYQVHSATTALWDNFWYSGSYSYVNYSLAWAPLAQVVGLTPLALASVAVAVGAFGGIVVRVWGPTAHWSARAFGLVWPATLFSGDYPFLLGVALGLMALLCLVSWWPSDGRQWRVGRLLPNACFAMATMLALAASPPAFLGLVLLVTLAAIANGRRWFNLAGPLVILGALGLAEVLLTRAFPGDGTYPFWVTDLLEILGFCALGSLMSWRVPRARALRLTFVTYGVLSLAVFMVPTPVGAIMSRFQDAALPVMVLLAGLRNWRPRGACIAAIVAAGAWTAAPVVSFLATSDTAVAAGASYWAPAVAYLNSHLAPSYRVEAVDTSGHWPAYYLAGAGIPLVRGWFRQADFPTNEILYASGSLGAPNYVSWLRGLGVAYVVRTDAPSDFSSAAEAALLASGHSGLNVVLRSSHLTVYAVPSPTPMVTGPAPASVVSLTRTALSVKVAAAGTYRLAIHWTPYWHTSQGCITEAPGGMTTLATGGPGVARISFGVDPSLVLRTILNNPPPTCPPVLHNMALGFTHSAER